MLPTFHFSNIKSIKQLTGFVFSLPVLFCFICSTEATAQGDLMITPRRVLFEGQKKTQELNLANTGKDTARYLISLMEIRMKKDGSFEQVTVPDSGQNFASGFIRFFPRRVTLGPGEAQAIKIQVTKQSQMVAGEYRSHIYFRAVPEEKPLGEKETAVDSAGISVHLTPIFGISIPIIIRVGENLSTVTLSNASFEMLNNSTPVMDLVFNREGNMSTYGDISIVFISPQGQKTQVAQVRGIAVYTPVTSRSMRVTLDKIAGVNYKTGKLHVVYKSSSDAKPLIMAETELVLF